MLQVRLPCAAASHMLAVPETKSYAGSLCFWVRLLVANCGECCAVHRTQVPADALQGRRLVQSGAPPPCHLLKGRLSLWRGLTWPGIRVLAACPWRQ